MSTPLQLYMNTKKKIEGLMKSTFLDSQTSQKSMHSQDRYDGELEGSEKIFSFNQSFTNIEQNEKVIQEKANFLNRIRSLQQELKSCKSRSSLWEKAKSQIFNLNKYLKLSAISLGCSDSAIMQEYFEKINDLIQSKEVKNKNEMLKVVENKKKEAELFEKLVQSNKKKYELQQKILQLEHENQKLLGLNALLREKSRVQSTERSSKFRQFHQETIITMQQKEQELSKVMERNNELKLQLVNYQQTIAALKEELQLKQKDLVQTKDSNEELYLECEAHKRQYNRLLAQQKQLQIVLINVKEQMQKILFQNCSFQSELKQKKQEISNLKSIIQDAKLTNQAYFNQIQEEKQEEQVKRRASLALLIQNQQNFKKSLTNNSRFAINRRKSANKNKILLHSKSEIIFHKINSEI